jgi:hypothetical protein
MLVTCVEARGQVVKPIAEIIGIGKKSSMVQTSGKLVKKLANMTNCGKH